MHHVPLAFQSIYGCSEEEGEDEDGKEGRKWILPGLLYADDLVLRSESEEDLKAMVRRFVEVYRKRPMKVNAGKSNIMVMNREEGLECEVHVDGIRLEYPSEFKYLGLFWTNRVQMGQNVVGRWPVGGG